MATVRMPQATAEDPVKLDPRHYAIEFESERVRVLRIKQPCDYFAAPVTLRFLAPSSAARVPTAVEALEIASTRFLPFAFAS
jgi:hypothetical protein